MEPNVPAGTHRMLAWTVCSGFKVVSQYWSEGQFCSCSIIVWWRLNRGWHFLLTWCQIPHYSGEAVRLRMWRNALLWCLDLKIVLQHWLEPDSATVVLRSIKKNAWSFLRPTRGLLSSTNFLVVIRFIGPFKNSKFEPFSYFMLVAHL